VRNQVDEGTGQIIGKLLVDEDKEVLTPDIKTYGVVAGMMGGFYFFCFYIAV
jgi:hypothetical protein